MSDGARGRSPLLDGVSHETLEKLAIYAGELKRWQNVTNLVGPKTLDEVWTRHFADSLQLLGLAEGRVWADLGSGAGFPGLVLAAAGPALTIHLVDSDSRRCAFLRHVARRFEADVRVHDARIEAALDRLDPRPEVVTARAVAPLDHLLGWSENLLRSGVVGLFPKGRDYARELTEARLSWTFNVDVIPSRVDPEGRILRVSRLARARDETT